MQKCIFPQIETLLENTDLFFFYPKRIEIEIFQLCIAAAPQRKQNT